MKIYAIMINITFPDGSVRSYNEGITPYEIAQSISPRLAADVLAASVDGQVYDLDRPVNKDASLKLHKWEDQEAKQTFWHSSSHLMAEALCFNVTMVWVALPAHSLHERTGS